MSASEKDLNNLSPSHAGSNVAGNTSGTSGHIVNLSLVPTPFIVYLGVTDDDIQLDFADEAPSIAYYAHQPTIALQYPHQSVTNPGALSKPPSHAAKLHSSQKPPSNPSATPTQKPKSNAARPPANPPTTVKPSATTNTPVAPPKNAPAPTPPGSAAVMAAVMAQAQAAAGQAVAAQHAKQHQQQASSTTSTQPVTQPPPPVPAPQAPQAYSYPYPYYMPGQPGAPPYIYPGAPGAPAFLPTGTPGQGGAPPPGYPYMYPMYPAPIPVPQTSPTPATKEKKSQRTYQACQKCRQWKAKCNGLKPCNHCQKRGVPCEYAERRNMPGPSETAGTEPNAPQNESAPPGAPQPAPDVKPVDGQADAVEPSRLTNTQPSPNPPVVESPQPQSSAPAPPAPAPAQASPPHAGSPPHPAQATQPPPPMAMYPPPPPGYAYPPQLYPGMPFPPPGPDPNAPYAHFVSMQYAQPYGPYMWAAPPPPPGHEQVPGTNSAEQEDGERDADGKLKIKRTFQACQKCRQRKAKCNGARPSCQHCATRGLVCEYAKERSKPRGANGEEGDESLEVQSPDAPTTMDPNQALVSSPAQGVPPNPQATPGAPPVPTAAPPNMFQPPFAYDPNAYNPHVDPHQHGGQPIYAFPPYGYPHHSGFGSIAGPPLVHIGEEGPVASYHPAIPPPVAAPGPPPPPPSATTPGPSKRPRASRTPGAPGGGKARIFQACERCRERKAKCDGIRPVCTHCAARDLACEWAGKRRMRGPAKGITPRRNRPESNFAQDDGVDVNMNMPAVSIGLNTTGLQTIEQHNSTTAAARKRKRRPSHSSGSPSPSESSSSSSSSPSESEDDEGDRNSTMGVGAGVVSSGWS